MAPQPGDPNNITERDYVDQCVPLVGHMNAVSKVKLTILDRPGSQLARDLDGGSVGSVWTRQVRSFLVEAHVIIINMEKVPHAGSHIGSPLPLRAIVSQCRAT